MTISFNEVRFPTDVALGARGGPERRTDVVTLRSGAEPRNAIWADGRRKYQAGYGIKGFPTPARSESRWPARCASP